MTGTEFILAAYCDEATYNEPQPITPEEAAVTIAAWKEEGFPVPVSVTPLLFARVWNIQCERGR